MMSPINIKNKAIGDIRFNYFKYGAIMACVSNQTKNLPATLTNAPFDEMKPLATFR
jgi:hypothetical protein